jgi:hypothetical protein
MCERRLLGVISKNGVGLKEYKQGVIDKQSLSPANDTVNKGIYDATTLSAVDADLAPANIKQGVTIFGKLGTLTSGGTETIEKYADATLAAGATYTPAASGIFFIMFIPGTLYLGVYYYSTAGASWYPVEGDTGYNRSAMAIGDGTNFRIKNEAADPYEYCLFRHYYSTGTYERARDEQLAAGASWTPAVSGFFAMGSSAISVVIQGNKTTAGWDKIDESSVVEAITIGDGANLRVYNGNGAAQYHTTLRAKMT